MAQEAALAGGPAGGRQAWTAAGLALLVGWVAACVFVGGLLGWPLATAPGPAAAPTAAPAPPPFRPPYPAVVDAVVIVVVDALRHDLVHGRDMPFTER